MTAAADTRAWYVVRTHPHAEVKASLHLQQQGYEIYLPCYRKRRRHARRVDTVRAPLFPRYLFVGFDIATQRWRSILSTIGVAQLVRHGDEPVPVPPQVIEELKSREDEAGLICLPTPPAFTPGDRIRVLSGAFADLFGFFETMTEAERVTVLLDLLGRKVRVAMTAEAIVAA
jgi:transcriptional antiterminator RfaH